VERPSARMAIVQIVEANFMVSALEFRFS
jgi:hypothetical protein